MKSLITPLTVYWTDGKESLRIMIKKMPLSFRESLAHTVKLKKNVSLQVVDELLQQRNIFTEMLNKLESATNVAKQTLFLGGLCFVLSYLAIGYAANFLCYFLGFVFPTYASVKAIETSHFSDDNKWLTYWVVFGTVNLLEVFIEWIPLYFLLKFLLLVWCMFPGEWSGTTVIYHYLIRPLVMRHKDTFDTAISEVAKHVRQVAEKTAEDYKPENNVDFLAEVHNIRYFLAADEANDSDEDPVEIKRRKLNNNMMSF